MTKEKLENIDPQTRKRLDVSMAVCLIENLFKRGEITEKTFKGVKKDAEKMIDTKDGI